MKEKLICMVLSTLLISCVSHQERLIKVVGQKETKTLRKILQTKDCNVNFRIKSIVNSPPLLDLAVFTQDVKIVRLLLDAGADINLANDVGFTALHSAAMQDNNRILKILVEEYQANINLQIKSNLIDGRHGMMTPLMAAVISGNSINCIEYLLKRGADLELKNISGATVFDLAKRASHFYNKKDVLVLLRKERIRRLKN